MKKNKNKKKRKVLRKVLLVIVLILLIAGGVFAYKVHKNGGGMTGMLATMVGHDENTKKNLGETRRLEQRNAFKEIINYIKEQMKNNIHQELNLSILFDYNHNNLGNLHII